MTIATRIKTVRESLGMTQKEFGKELGTVSITISRWECSKNEPRGRSLEKFLKMETAQKDSSPRVKALQKKCLDQGLLNAGVLTLMPHLAEGDQKAVLQAILKGR